MTCGSSTSWTFARCFGSERRRPAGGAALEFDCQVKSELPRLFWRARCTFAFEISSCSGLCDAPTGANAALVQNPSATPVQDPSSPCPGPIQDRAASALALDGCSIPVEDASKKNERGPRDPPNSAFGAPISERNCGRSSGTRLPLANLLRAPSCVDRRPAVPNGHVVILVARHHLCV